MAIINESNAQVSGEVQVNNAKWADVRVGIVADLEGKLFEFPSISLGVGGNYNTKPLLYTIRLNFNLQLGVLADASSNYIWDLGFLVGKYFEGGTNQNRKIVVSGGIGMIWGSTGGSTAFFYLPTEDISGLAFVHIPFKSLSM